MQVDNLKIPTLNQCSSPVPFQTEPKKKHNLLSASMTKDSNASKANDYVEKMVYRSQKISDDDKQKNFDEMSVHSSASSIGSAARLKKSRSSQMKAINEDMLNKTSVNWTDLGEKIDDWFSCAKTPDQRVVYKFLRNLKEDDEIDRESIMSVSLNNRKLSDKAQSLEDILQNLKKYRHKLNTNTTSEQCQCRKSCSCKQARRENAKSAMPRKSSEQNLNRMFESSTWRVMRHLKSADIRNKYPLPKANPDYHFRNATIFTTAGRPPKSTFLLHPDWV